MPLTGLHSMLRAICAVLGIGPLGTHAWAEAPAPKTSQYEAWAGAEVFRHVWSLYAGGTYAPFGIINTDGIRLRAVAGYGAYSHASPRWTGARVETFTFHGTTTFADALAGYHKQLGSVTIKFFAGLTLADKDGDDPELMVGTDIGAKAVVETWWNITDQAWTSVDLSWTTLHDIYGARARLGWRLLPTVSIGMEAGATGSWGYDTARIGGFVRYEWASGEASLSAGVSGDGPSSRAEGVQGPFATINVLNRF